MMENEEMTVEGKFYQDVAELLGVESNYEYNVFTHGGKYRTRWNNRNPGNGRFEGFGLVRYFGPSVIHVMIKHPVTINGVFSSTDDVLSALKKALDENKSAS